MSESGARWAAAIAASQLEPSCSSPSPSITTVRAPFLCSLAPSAMPSPMERPWPRSAGRHLDTGDLDVGVHAEQGFVGVEGVHEAVVHEAGLGQHRAESRVRVPLGEHEAVAVGPVRLVGPEPEVVEVKARPAGRRRRASPPYGRSPPPAARAHVLRRMLSACARSSRSSASLLFTVPASRPTHIPTRHDAPAPRARPPRLFFSMPDWLNHPRLDGFVSLDGGRSLRDPACLAHIATDATVTTEGSNGGEPDCLGNNRSSPQPSRGIVRMGGAASGLRPSEAKAFPQSGNVDASPASGGQLRAPRWESPVYHLDTPGLQELGHRARSRGRTKPELRRRSCRPKQG